MTEHKRRGPYPKPIEVERRRTVGEHTHRQPRWPILCLSGAVLALTAAVIVLTFYVVSYSEHRAQEAERIGESVRAAVCDVLDQLQAGTRLDVVREQYDCGPGRFNPQEEP